MCAATARAVSGLRRGRLRSCLVCAERFAAALGSARCACWARVAGSDLTPGGRGTQHAGQLRQGCAHAVQRFSRRHHRNGHSGHHHLHCEERRLLRVQQLRRGHAVPFVLDWQRPRCRLGGCVPCSCHLVVRFRRARSPLPPSYSAYAQLRQLGLHASRCEGAEAGVQHDALRRHPDCSGYAHVLDIAWCVAHRVSTGSTSIQVRGPKASKGIGEQKEWRVRSPVPSRC